MVKIINSKHQIGVTLLESILKFKNYVSNIESNVEYASHLGNGELDVNTQQSPSRFCYYEYKCNYSLKCEKKALRQGVKWTQAMHEIYPDSNFYTILIAGYNKTTNKLSKIKIIAKNGDSRIKYLPTPKIKRKYDWLYISKIY